MPRVMGGTMHTTILGRAVGRRALSALLLMVLTAALVPLQPMAVSAATDPKTFWVDDDGLDSNPGTEAEPFKTIKYALSVASGLDTIKVKPGTYDNANGETLPLVMSGEKLISTDGPDVTIIEGPGTGQLLIANNPGTGDEISGFTFKGAGTGYAVLLSLGWATDPGWPLVESNVFTENTGTVTPLRINGNTSDNHPVIRGNVFEDNFSTSMGAGLYVDMQNGPSTTTIEDNYFKRNTSDGGSALTLITSATTATVTGNVFKENAALVNYGGAVYMSNSGGQYHTFEGNYFAENTAAKDGGAMWIYGADVNLKANEAYGNQAGNRGGFGYIDLTYLVSQNNLIAENSAITAGGAWHPSGAATLYMRNDTVVNNTGPTPAVLATTTTDLGVWDCVLWNPGSSADISGADYLMYSLTRDTTATLAANNNDVSGEVLHSDPRFRDASGSDYRLLGDSPCIDTADQSSSSTVDFFGTTRPVDGDRNGSARNDMGFHEYTPPDTTRLADDTRFSTAVDIAIDAFPDWWGVSDVIIASGDDRAAADPLAAAGLCWAYDAPMLLVSATKTPTEVKQAIKGIVDANGPVTLHVVGGSLSVPDARVNDIKAYAGASNVTSDRILKGGGRYDLARAIAKRMREVDQADPDKDMAPAVLFANGADSSKFFDALALSPISAANGIPILLVEYGKVPAATTAAITELGSPTKRIVGGGPKTVSETVRKQLGATRWDGATRYDTATRIADSARAQGWLDREVVGIAAKLPDALTGGSTVGLDGGVLLITDGSKLSSATKTWLLTNKAYVSDCRVFGGTKSVAPAVKTEIENALK